jgi:hypothetical protein
MTALDLLRQAEADVLLEASPLDLETGQPGLSCIRAALSRGMHVVTANKGPLVLAYQELMELARSNGVGIRFSATVGGGLPAVNIGQRDLAGASIHRLEGVLNLTNLRGDLPGAWRAPAYQAPGLGGTGGGRRVYTAGGPHRAAPVPSAGTPHSSPDVRGLPHRHRRRDHRRH